MTRPITTTRRGEPIYVGRHQHHETQRIALVPAAPMPPATVRMPALRLLPPVQPDRRDGWKLTRRGRIAAQGVAGAAILGLAVAFDPLAHAFVQLTVTVGQIVGAL